MNLLSYLFPRLKQRDRIPLLPRKWSSPHHPYHIGADIEEDIALIKIAGLAQTDADAVRLLKKYPGQDVQKTILISRRARKPRRLWRRAFERLKRIW